MAGRFESVLSIGLALAWGRALEKFQAELLLLSQGSSVLLPPLSFTGILNVDKSRLGSSTRQDFDSLGCHSAVAALPVLVFGRTLFKTWNTPFH